MALVRIKRRAQDDPIDVLLLAAKKQKTEEPHLTNVFRFAATVPEKVEDVKNHISHIFKTVPAPSLETKYKTHEVTNITDKLRAENKLFSQENRLKVVNHFRAVHRDEEIDQGKTLTVVDIESSPLIHAESTDSNNLSGLTAEQYVYDLYYSTEGDLDDLQMEHVLSAHEVDEKLIFGDTMDDDDDREDNMNGDDEDSNDENNPKNEYPDDDDDSIDEDDMRLAMNMKKCNMESDLSSDHDDEDLIYGDDEDRGHYYVTASDNSSEKSDSDFDGF